MLQVPQNPFVIFLSVEMVYVCLKRTLYMLGKSIQTNQCLLSTCGTTNVKWLRGKRVCLRLEPRKAQNEQLSKSRVYACTERGRPKVRAPPQMLGNVVFMEHHVTLHICTFPMRRLLDRSCSNAALPSWLENVACKV